MTNGSWLVPAFLSAALVLTLLWLGQRRLIYLPFGRVPPPADIGLPHAEAISFRTADGITLEGWFVPAGTPQTPDAGLARGRMTTIVFNGNAGHRGLRAPLGVALAGHGIATLLMDYRGYGGNPGSPSEAGLAEDARAARNYVLGRPDVDPTRLVYFGESLGTGVAVRLAAEHPPRALILRSPFTSLADVGRYHYPFLPVRTLLRDRFDSLNRIRDVSCPLLVLAGDRDGIIPVAQSERLYAEAAPPKQFVMIDGADHNDYELLAGERLVAAVVEFIRVTDGS